MERPAAAMAAFISLTDGLAQQRRRRRRRRGALAAFSSARSRRIAARSASLAGALGTAILTRRRCGVGVVAVRTQCSPRGVRASTREELEARDHRAVLCWLWCVWGASPRSDLRFLPFILI